MDRVYLGNQSLLNDLASWDGMNACFLKRLIFVVQSQNDLEVFVSLLLHPGPSNLSTCRTWLRKITYRAQLVINDVSRLLQLPQLSSFPNVYI